MTPLRLSPRVWLSAGLLVLALHLAVLLLVQGWATPSQGAALGRAGHAAPVALLPAPTVAAAEQAALSRPPSVPPPPILSPALPPFPPLRQAATGVPLLAPALPPLAATLDLAGPSLTLATGGAPAMPAIYTVDEVDQAPQAIYRLPPPYPLAARRQQLSGKVVARLQVSATGTVQQVQILTAEPADVFDASVRQTLSHWRFSPAVRDGRPVAVWLDVPILFELEGH